MRKAFTLIEVLVAVGIISVVVMALLQTKANNAKLTKNIIKQMEVKDEFSLVLLNAKNSYHAKTKTLYDLLKSKFDIKDDDMQRWLKKERFSYAQDEFSQVKISTDEFGGDMGSLNILIDKITTISQKGQNVGYTMSVE